MNKEQALQEIDKLIDADTPRIFPYSTVELQEITGLNRMAIWRYLNGRGLRFDGHRWVYRSISEREHE